MMLEKFLLGDGLFLKGTLVDHKMNYGPNLNGRNCLLVK